MSGFVISIHAPPRGATAQAFALLAAVLQFQFTPLREGRQLRRSPCSPPSSNFNSRPSARGDGNWVRKIKTIDISIHAPPRGATCGRPPSPQSGRPISIHAPPRGATLYQRETTPLQVGFQFTTLREGRRPFRGREVLFRRISIHAPPRGATFSAFVQRQKALFQFTPLREGRRAPCWLRASSTYFNSRPSARGDQNARKKIRTPLISIHAPPRGATSRFFHAAFAALFQFTPLREGRRHRICRGLSGHLFQFTPLREGRLSVQQSHGA